MMTEQIGTRLQQVRLALGITQVDIAKTLGYSPKFFTSMENNHQKPNIVFIAKICREYDISIDSLVYDTDKQFEKLLNDLKGVRL